MSVAKRKVVLGLLIILITAALMAVWLNRQFLVDWQVVQAYRPTSAIVQIADRSGMSDKGRFMFYASQPTISEAESFNQQCERREAAAAVLGCYNAGRIYIYKIDSVELDGIKEVTAAHEMLHAVWDRLSDSDKDYLSGRLEGEYQRIKTDTLEQRMSYYERQQPGERLNELHSILATEISQLDDDLERHYTKYFTDRQIIVGLHEQYEAVFTNLKNQSDQLRQEITAMIEQLNADITIFNEQIAQLDSEISEHNKQLYLIDRTNASAVEVYNVRQTALTARQVALSQEESRLDQRRRDYEQKVQQYNELTIRSEELTGSLDSLKKSTLTAE